MDRDEFMNVVYEELQSDGDNNRANRIIDAADEYAESMEPRWIPVTERLPEEDDYRPCYGYEDGAVWWCNDMWMMGLGWYYPSTGKWAYYNESYGCEECAGNVVAWTHLPKLYRGGKA